jgi:ribosomal protein S27AE
MEELGFDKVSSEGWEQVIECPNCGANINAEHFLVARECTRCENTYKIYLEKEED